MTKGTKYATVRPELKREKGFAEMRCKKGEWKLKYPEPEWEE